MNAFFFCNFSRLVIIKRKMMNYSFVVWLGALIFPKYTHEARPHVETSVLGIYNWHIAQSYVESVPEYRYFELCFKLRLVETRKRRSRVRGLEMRCCEISAKLISEEINQEKISFVNEIEFFHSTASTNIDIIYLHNVVSLLIINFLFAWRKMQLIALKLCQIFHLFSPSAVT